MHARLLELRCNGFFRAGRRTDIFTWQEEDANSTIGAWWVPLQVMVEDVGKEEVEQKLEEFDVEVKRLRALMIDVRWRTRPGKIRRTSEPCCVQYLTKTLRTDED